MYICVYTYPFVGHFKGYITTFCEPAYNHCRQCTVGAVVEVSKNDNDVLTSSNIIMDKQLCKISRVDFTWSNLQVEQSLDATVHHVSGGCKRLGQDLLYDGGKKGKKRGKRRKNVIPQSELPSYILFTVKLKSP